MDMQLIKRIEKPIPKNVETKEELSQPTLRTDTGEIQEPVIENNPVMDSNYTNVNYIPVRDNPLVQSVGNSGWQASEIWRDLRIDNFYD
ncbi:hypothetical protein [Nostoc sp. 106C]|uniref:hypothetical protein n=1 Tax=Nostoc sp. 106C TaxID=1932667 RepID=UPI000A37C77A|nr:hypothetical protein [Nostoc sp. 106C]OUL32372.1 hypothetical protein BV375_10010 [Nostoc sp. 106C]